MTVVQYLLTDTASRPLLRHTVHIALVAPGNPHTGAPSAVIQQHTVSTDSLGIFSADLIPTSEYEYLGATYRVDAREGGITTLDDAVWHITVPDTGGPYDLRDLLVADPDVGEPVPPVTAHALTDHTDVDTGTVNTGDLLAYDGTDWVPQTPAGGTPHALGDHTDVDTTGQASGNILGYDGTTWVPVTDQDTTDHGALTGLADDDHTQYHNDSRGDARYYTQTQVDTALTGKENTGVAATLVSDHEAAADPHPAYLLESDLQAELADTPRSLLYAAGWPARGTSSRPTFFIGGSEATDEPTDADIAAGDVWLPETA